MPRYADKYLIHFRKPLTNICKETFATKLMDCGRALAFNPANPSNYLGTLRLTQLSKNTIEGFKNIRRGILYQYCGRWYEHETGGSGH